MNPYMHVPPTEPARDAVTDAIGHACDALADAEADEAVAIYTALGNLLVAKSVLGQALGERDQARAELETIADERDKAWSELETALADLGHAQLADKVRQVIAKSV